MTTNIQNDNSYKRNDMKVEVMNTKESEIR